MGDLAALVHDLASDVKAPSEPTPGGNYYPDLGLWLREGVLKWDAGEEVLT